VKRHALPTDIAARRRGCHRYGFLEAAKAFAAQLPNDNPGSFAAGFHDDAYWRSIAPAQLTTIAQADKRAQ
jgi:hypothetical protein